MRQSEREPDQTAVIVGVAGGSASGKTTLVEALPGFLPGVSTSLLHHDDYYHDRPDLAPAARAGLDFDVPAALDSRLLASHLRRLKAGQPVQSPVYCFETHSRLTETREVTPTDAVIVDGMLLLAVPGLRELFDVSVYVDAPADLRLARRITRDVTERGRSVESVIEQYLRTVRPAHEAFVEPSKQHADTVIADATNDSLVRRVARLIRSSLPRPAAPIPTSRELAE